MAVSENVPIPDQLATASPQTGLPALLEGSDRSRRGRQWEARAVQEGGPPQDRRNAKITGHWCDGRRSGFLLTTMISHTRAGPMIQTFL